MMMSKPISEKEREEEHSTAFAVPPSAKTGGTVEDLERRLGQLGDSNNKAEANAATASPSMANTAAGHTASAGSAAIKGGKNALLARIIAAKEKQEEKKTAAPVVAAAPAPAAPAVDLLLDFDAPAAEKDPPPNYNTNFLQDAPPPTFDVAEQQQQQFLSPPPIDSISQPVPPSGSKLSSSKPEDDLLGMTPSGPTATAPMFQDLLGAEPTQEQTQHPPTVPSPTEAEAAPAALDIDESILNALEPAEREAFLEEQRKIMEQIEKEKSNNEASGAAARAMAFDQRSASAVANVAASYEGGGRSKHSGFSSGNMPSNPSPVTSNDNGRVVNLGGEAGEVAVHGPEKSQKAIEDGTAVIVKCMSCDNWMQVTEAAELMFCPICQVVCPVEKKGAATTADMEAAAQLAADAELADRLQKEEYAGAQERRSRPRNGAQHQHILPFAACSSTTGS